MTTRPNAVPETPLESQTVAPAGMPPTQPLYWLVRRELWENRSIYVAPLVVAAVFLAGFLISLIHLPAKIRAALSLSPAQQHEIIEQPYDLASLLLMGAMVIVAAFYCLDALYGERRDRSILFWKSLPVSDLMTVLSKASIPMIILPLVIFAITVVTQFLMLLLSSVVLLGSGLNIAMLWTHLSFFHMSVMLLFHLVAIHGIWYAPFYGWLLLVSAWARRAPFLWGVLPPFAICVVERHVFSSSHFCAVLQNRFMGGPSGVASAPGSMSMDALTPANFLSSPGLWIGLGVTAVFLAAAVRLRRYREPI